MKMIVRKAILKSIEHHKRMQKWVKKEKPVFDGINEFKWQMKDAISESFWADDCPLCQLFDFDIGCYYCPLAQKYGECGYRRNAWSSLITATTWKEWLKADEKLVRQLRSLLKIKEKK